MRALIKIVIPAEDQRRRAHGLSHEALFLYATFIFLVQFGISFVSLKFPGILGFASNIKVEEIIEATNKRRAENNLPLLRVNEKLTQAAQLKAAYMFEKDFWAHVAPDGTTPWKFILQSGYRYLYAGENLAKDFQDTQDVVGAWMNSKAGHKENILGESYSDIGVAVVKGTLAGFQTTLVVQMFGSTSRPTAVARAQAPAAEKLETAKPAVTEELPSPAVVPVPSGPALPVLEGQPKVAVVDVLALAKNVSFAFGFFLLILFLVDGFIVFRKRSVRISGHNGAHILILLLILSSTWFISAGAIR